VCVDEQLFQEVVAMKEIMINSLDKSECANVFCLADLIGAGGGLEKHKEQEYIVPG